MRISRRLLTAALALPAAAPVALRGQGADSGAFVITLGRDTIALERFIRVGDRLTDDMLLRDRSPVVLRHFDATLKSDGSIARLEVVNTVGGSPTVHGVGTYKPEEVLFEVTQSGNTQVGHVITPHGALPFFNFCYALYEVTGRRARVLGGNPVKVPVISFGGTLPFDLMVTFPKPDSMGVAFAGDAPTLFKVDAAGRILSVEGRLTTQQVVATRLPTLDIAAAAAGYAARPLGTLSPPDSVRATIGGAAITIEYGRPTMRGRTIFGGLVPWGRVWRTGANFATRFTTSADLVVGTRTIPKGTYTLWTLPTPTGWTLIFNKQTKAPCEGAACNLPSRAPLWGTDYAADSDFARVDLAVTRLNQPIEQFTITVLPEGRGGVLELAWETKRASIPFTTR
jgi:DUF2911 family protein